MEANNTADVRSVVPRLRHETFATFHNLKPGEAFVLVNDHDPKPLYYQFQAERPGQFSWDYLEQGPRGLAGPDWASWGVAVSCG